VGFVANTGAGALLPELEPPPQKPEEFVELWRRILQTSSQKIQGKDAKVAMGVRRWVVAPDDPRAWENP
jgi:hypothetical protein